MRHRKSGRKLGVTTKHRKAMFRNMATDLLRNGKINTTDTRAKEIRRVVEKLVTLGKNGSLHARRKALSYIRDRAVVEKLFSELAQRYMERPGGYTRIVKLGYRRGDNAPISLIELVTEEYKASADDDVFVMVQIEHRNAVECVEEIADVPGIDALFIGPGDLSYSYGLPFQFDHPTNVDAVQKVVDTGRAKGLPVAMAVDSTPEEVLERIEQGIQLVTVGLDWMFMRNAIKEQTAAVRALL